MSEERPAYIPCAAGNALQSDLLVRRCGDLVEIIGHPSALLTPEDAELLCGALTCLIAQIRAERAPPGA